MEKSAVYNVSLLILRFVSLVHVHYSFLSGSTGSLSNLIWHEHRDRTTTAEWFQRNNNKTTLCDLDKTLEKHYDVREAFKNVLADFVR